MISLFHKIAAVAPLDGFRLLVCFQSGERMLYDMKPLLHRVKDFSPLLSVPGLFRQAVVDPGGFGVSWNDEIDISGSELWANGQLVRE